MGPMPRVCHHAMVVVLVVLAPSTGSAWMAGPQTFVRVDARRADPRVLDRVMGVAHGLEGRLRWGRLIVKPENAVWRLRGNDFARLITEHKALPKRPSMSCVGAIMWTAVLSQRTPLGALVALHEQAARAAAEHIGNPKRGTRALMRHLTAWLLTGNARAALPVGEPGVPLSPDVVPQRGDVVLLVKLGGIIVHAGIALGEKDLLGRQRMLSLAAEHPTFGKGPIPRYGLPRQDGSGAQPKLSALIGPGPW